MIMAPFLEKAIEMFMVKFFQTHPVTQWQLESLGSLILSPGSNAAGRKAFIIELIKTYFM